MRNGTILALSLIAGIGTVVALRSQEPPVIVAPKALALVKIEPLAIAETQADDGNRDYASVPDGPLFYDFQNWMETAPQAEWPESIERRRRLVAIWRTASPTLRRFQELSSNYEMQEVIAGEIYTCGLRSYEWYGHIAGRLQEQLSNDPAVLALRQNLSEGEIVAANAYTQFGKALRRRFDPNCQTMAGMPYVYRYDAYERGQLRTLRLE